MKSCGLLLFVCVLALPLQTRAIEAPFLEGKKVISGSQIGIKVRCGDFDGDGDKDLIYLGATNIVNSTRVWFIENLGAGNFGRPVSLSSSTDFRRIAVGDIDGDGDEDVMAANQSSPYRLDWFENRGDGSFLPRANLMSLESPPSTGLHLTDLNGDDRLDILMASYSSVAWMENMGSAAFGSETKIDTDVSAVRSADPADINGDGLLDVVSWKEEGSRLVWHRNTGGGQFAEPVTVADDIEDCLSAEAADIDGDGRLDVVASYHYIERIDWFRQEEDGSFGSARPVSQAFERLSAILTADIDSDGDTDVVSLSDSVYWGGKVAWHSNDGNGNFEFKYLLTSGQNSLYDVIAVDLDGDNDIDVAATGDNPGFFDWYENQRSHVPLVDFLRSSEDGLEPGSPVTLSWAVHKADSLVLQPGGIPLIGNSMVVYPSQTTEYTLVATNSEGAISTNVLVKVASAPEIRSFRPGFNQINSGNSVNLYWDVTDATDIQISPDVGVVTGNRVEITPTATPLLLVESGSVWSYLDDGTALDGLGWQLPDFDDSAWSAGAAQLGYGDGDEATVTSFGPSPGDKHITTYFRRNFLVSDPTAVSSLKLAVLRDDGAVVYLNGVEVARTNMPDGTISFGTLAGGGITNEDELRMFALDNSALVAGENTVAVEIHQVNATSSDMSFDLELEAEGLFSPVTYTITATNAKGSVTATTTVGFDYEPIFDPSVIEVQDGGSSTTSTLATTAGDFNQDGFSDFVVAGQLTSFNGSIVWFEGIGDSTFKVREDIVALQSRSPQDVEAADLNGDGLEDLVSVAGTGDGGLVWLLGNGDGSFGSLRETATSGLATARYKSMAIGDFDGDGDEDVFVAFYNGSSSRLTWLEWFRNDGDGNLISAGILNEPVTSIEAVDTADFNGDGFADIVYCDGGEDAIVILLGNGTTEGFDDGILLSSSMVAITSVVVLDFDADGDLDLAAIHKRDRETRLSVFVGDGKGGFERNLMEVDAFSGRLFAADFNGDGFDDLIGDKYYYENEGNGRFAGARDLGVQQIGSVAIGDVDGDMDLDVFISFNLLLNRSDPAPSIRRFSGVYNAANETVLLEWDVYAAETVEIDHGVGVVEGNSLEIPIIESKTFTLTATSPRGVASATVHVLLDSDLDGLPDSWELRYFYNLDQSSEGDPDGDDVNNGVELSLGTNPMEDDSDFDGIPDGDELTGNTDPTKADTDGDGHEDGEELAAGTDATDPLSFPLSELLNGLVFYSKLDALPFLNEVSQESGFVQGNTVSLTGPGQIGDALVFTPTLPRHVSFDQVDAGLDAVSYSFWFKMTAMVPGQRIFSMRQQEMQQQFKIVNGRLRVDSVYDSGARESLLSENVLIPNQWYHVAINASGNSLQGALNGDIGGFNFTAPSSEPFNPGQVPQLLLGATAPGPASFYGCLDELAIWQRPLEAEDIAKLYTYGTDRRSLDSINGRELPPVFIKQPKGGVFEAGESVTLSVDFEGTEPLTLQWMRNGLVIPGATSKEYVIPSISQSNSGILSAVLTGALGTVTSSGVLVKVIDFNARRFAPEILTGHDRYTVGGQAAHIEGDYMFLGAPNRYESQLLVYKRDDLEPSGWKRVQTIDKTGPRGYLGREISGDGDWMAVADGVYDVFLYKLGTDGLWSLDQQLTRPEDVSTGIGFGSALDMDGDRLVIGAGSDSTLGTNAGAVYVFERNPSTDVWEETAHLTEGDEHSGLGSAVAVDGDTIVATALGYTQSQLPVRTGGAYIFQKTGPAPDAWSLVRQLDPDIIDSHVRFGTFADIEGDTVVVGAPESDFGLYNSGAVYVFERNAGGLNEWGQTARLLKPERKIRDQFGWQVAIENGRLYTTFYNDEPPYTLTGGLYVYERMSNGDWEIVASEFEPVHHPNRGFGWTMAADGERVVVVSFGGLSPLGEDQETRFYYYEFPPTENAAPQFSGTPASIANPGLLYNVTFSVEEPDGHEVQVGAAMLPGWLRLVQNGDDSVTLSGTPSAADVGVNPIQLIATDGFPDGTSFLDFEIEVERVPTILTITADEPATSVFREPVTVHFNVTADTSAPLSIQPTGTVTLSAPGSASVVVSLPVTSGVIHTGQSGSLDITATYSGDGTFFESRDTEEHLVIPEVSLTQERTVVPENGGVPVRFEISRTGTTQSALQVAVEIAGSALPVLDFLSTGELPEFYVIPEGQSSVMAEFPLVDDNVEELDDSLSLEILAGGYRIEDGTGMKTAVISDDDYSPVANADQWSVIEDSSLSISSAAGVLANDTDRDDGGGPVHLTSELVEPTTHGQVNLSPDGSFSYTPEKDFFGTDQFRYRATDGSNWSSPVVVTIQVLEQVDLKVTLSESLDPLVVGHPQNGSVQHEITLTNNGPSHADNIRIALSVLVPTGVTASSPNGTIWNVARLLEGQSRKMTVTFTTDATAKGGSDSIQTGALVADVDQPLVNPLDDVAAVRTSIVSPQNVGTLAMQENEILKMQTGLMMQQLKVTNNNPIDADGFRVVISGLPADVSVYNASGSTPDGHSFVSYPQALAAGGSATLTIEYFSRRRSADFSPQYEIQLLIAGDDILNAAPGEKFEIDRSVRMEDGSVLIEWKSEPGERFIIEYSSDMQVWKRAGDAVITAGATRTQWIDSGAPKTDRHPGEASSRYYRVSKAKD